MADTKIEWCEKVWNPIAGCTKCSPGCLNCYAERMAIRLNGISAAKGDNDNWADYSSVLKWDYSKVEMGKAIGWNGDIALKYDRLDQPLHWRKPKRIFVCSMSDLFHSKVPLEFITKVSLVMARCPQHIFQVLTKRPEIALEHTKRWQKESGYSSLFGNNVHLGVSISNQAEADEKIPILLQIPAAVRWLSIEPMLGGIKINRIKTNERTLNALRGISKYKIDGRTPYYGHHIDWVVVGCESGPKRRTCKNKWIESIVDQCKSANIPVFVKQIHRDGKVVKMPKDFPQALMKGN